MSYVDERKNGEKVFMKISVVMATYNGEKYIKEQLDTIRKQTRKIDELVICDDKSTDRTTQIISDYIQQYGLGSEWKVYVNEKNLGYANNFHQAASTAQGEIIFFADQDDLWREDKIEVMMDIMEKYPDCQVLSSDYEPYYDGREETNASKKALKKMPDNNELEKIILSAKSIYIGAIGCCMCVRKEFYHKVNNYWFDNWAQDDRMWRLSQCMDGCYILHSALIKHRLHTNNTSTYGKYHTTEKRVNLFQAMQKANQVMYQVLEEQKAEKQQRTIMKKHISMMKVRIELLQKKNVLKCLKCIPYIPYYQEGKSFFVELYMVLFHK